MYYHKLMVITFDGTPLVALQHENHVLPTDVLDWYAETYAIERSRIKYSYVDTITMPFGALASCYDNDERRDADGRTL